MADRNNPFYGITDLISEFTRARETGLGREHAREERTHTSAWVPTTDIFVQGDRLVIRVELAGVNPADIDLHFASGILTVSGRRSRQFDDIDAGSGDTEEPDYYVRERYYGEFRRSITLPEGTQRDQIAATFDDGLVQIVVEGVSERAKKSRIKLQDRSGEAKTARPVG